MSIDVNYRLRPLLLTLGNEFPVVPATTPLGKIAYYPQDVSDDLWPSHIIISRIFNLRKDLLHDVFGSRYFSRLKMNAT